MIEVDEARWSPDVTPMWSFRHDDPMLVAVVFRSGWRRFRKWEVRVHQEVFPDPEPVTRFAFSEAGALAKVTRIFARQGVSLRRSVHGIIHDREVADG